MAGALIATVIGAMIGSFANVAIYRVPRGESLMRPRSRCPRCGHVIRARDNIPVLSFLLLGGRCRDCGAPISWRYPVVELITAVLFLGVWRAFGPSLGAVRAALFGVLLIVVIFIDLEHYLIPDALTYPAVAVGLLLALLEGIPFLGGGQHLGTRETVVRVLSPSMGAFASALGAGLFFLAIVIASRGGMGGGDVKLAAAMGAFLNWPGILVALFVSFMGGGLIAVTLLLARARGRKDPIPFGPFLALGGLVALFWGQEIIQWYGGV